MMKAIVEDINSVQRRVKVTVPPEAVNKAFSAYYQKVRGKAKVHGFRPGKVPMTLIRKMYGGSGSYDVVDQLVREHLLSSLRESGISAISQPYIENSNIPTEDQAYEISAIIDVLPEIKLNDQHKNLVVSYEHHTADDHMLGHRLEQLARQHATLKPVAESTRCDNGHLVKISYTAQIEGVDDPLLTMDEQVVEVGRHRLFIKEIEDALIGMNLNETKPVNVKFPSEGITEKYKGKSAVFNVTLKSIQKLEVPVIDEEFAKDLNYESLEDLKEKVRAGLAAHYTRLNEDGVHNALLTQLNDRVPFEVPPSITDQVIDHIISQSHFKNDSERQKALADKNMRAEVLVEAKMRAKNTMLLHELIKQEKLSLTNEEFHQAIAQLSRETDPAKKEADFNRNLREYGDNVREQLLFKKALNFLTSHATITPIPAAHDHHHHEEHDDHDHDHDHDHNHDHI